MKLKTSIISACLLLVLSGCSGDSAKISELEKEIVDLRTENEDLLSKTSELLNENEDLKKEITSLTDTIEELKPKEVKQEGVEQEAGQDITESKSQFEKGYETQSDTSFSTQEYSSNSTINYKDDNPNGVYNQEPTQQVESYQNCTLLREVYPDGVPEGHPAYASRHDRDKDGWACER